MRNNDTHREKAVVLLSGGLDSATTLAIASQSYDCYTLSFDYGQCAKVEISAAKDVAEHFAVKEHRVAQIDLSVFGGSALTDEKIDIPDFSEYDTLDIPVTYVPARNTIFLSYALAWAEVLNATSIFIGVNAVDYSGYPDCRPEFISAYQAMINVATKQSIEGDAVTIKTPLINLSKDVIITKGLELGLDYSKTVSCYNPDQRGYACGVCDSCHLRKQGFLKLSIDDPTFYQ
jgi:7-cyano-7-deazaguanine synthase